MSVASTSIQWCDSTWNILRGCSRKSSGCEHCYAERQAGRFSGPGQPYEGLVRKTSGGWRWTGEVRLIEKELETPLRWRKPKRIFVNSMSDLFHEDIPSRWIEQIFAVMARCPQHQFQVLTKRPARMQTLLSDRSWWALAVRSAPITDAKGHAYDPALDLALRNVWLGVSVEDQATADARVPSLLQTPAAVRFVSYEPALGPVTFWEWSAWNQRLEGCGILHEYKRGPNTVHGPGEVEGESYPGLDWLIVGGESGPHARPCDVAWLRSIVRQCRDAQVPVFVKQLGAKPYQSPQTDGGTGYELALKDRKGSDIEEWPSDLRVQQFPEEACHENPL